jgi:hypothetical protein
MADVWEHCHYLIDMMRQLITFQSSWQCQLLSNHSWGTISCISTICQEVEPIVNHNRNDTTSLTPLTCSSQITSVSPKGFLIFHLKNRTQHLWPREHSRKWTTRIPREAQTSNDVSADFDLVESQLQKIWATFTRPKNWIHLENGRSTNPQVSSSRN